jgi:hypothetical protein
MYRPSLYCSYKFRVLRRSANPTNVKSLPGFPSPLSTIFTHPKQPKLSSLRHCRYREQTRNMSSSSLKSPGPPSDPIDRTSSPYPDPRQLGPKSKILASRTSNFHSTSLRMVTATNPSVNRTCKSIFLSHASAGMSTST